eukprot:m.29146 g.29146  ORF g.29146 m.29146 type:complete len:793 (-) comp8068_c0_seq2:1376-3754(-)
MAKAKSAVLRELERVRSAQRWRKIPVLLDKIDHEGFRALCHGEYLLESYLSEHHRPFEDTAEPQESSSISINECTQQLQLAVELCNDTDKFEALMLLGRALFVSGNLQDAYDIFCVIPISDADHDRNSNSMRASPRVSLMYSQALVCFGLTLDTAAELNVELKDKAGIDIDQGLPLSLFLRSSHLYISRLEAVRTVHQTNSVQQQCINDDFHHAIHRAVELLTANNDISEALKLLRRCLKCQRLPSQFRLHIIHVTSILLLRAVPEPLRSSEDILPMQTPTSTRGPSVFVPCSDEEEIALLLLLDFLTRRSDPGCVQLDERAAQRICDIAWLVLPRHSEFQLLARICEKVQFLSREESTTADLALACTLACMSRYSSALQLLKNEKLLSHAESMRNIFKLDVHLIVALLYFKMDDYDQCFKHAQISHFQRKTGFHVTNHLMGISKYLSAGLTHDIMLRQHGEEEAMMLINKAVEERPDIEKYTRNLAITCLQTRNMVAAEFTAKSSYLRGQNFSKSGTSILVLALALSGRKRLRDAIKLCQAALKEESIGQDIRLKLFIAQAVAYIDGPEKALRLYQALLKDAARMFQSSHIYDIDFVGGVTDLSGSDVDDGSQDGSIATFVKSAATSLSRNECGAPYYSFWLAKAWLQTTECFLILRKYLDCESCILEATAMLPENNVEALYMSGQVEDLQENHSKAMQLYEQALQQNPTHAPSLRAMAVAVREENLRMAKNLLLSSVKADPYQHEAWLELGVTLTEMGEHTAGATAIQTAEDLEKVAPIMDTTFFTLDLH